MSCPAPATIPFTSWSLPLAFTVPAPFNVNVSLDTVSVWVPLEPPSVKPANVALMLSNTVYVPATLITTLSLLVGTTPVLQFDAVVHAPPAALIQYTVAGAARISKGTLLIGGRLGVENTSVYWVPG